MKCVSRFMSLCLAVFLLITPFISYASTPKYDGQLLENEKIWEAYYSGETVFYQFCDLSYIPDDDDISLMLDYFCIDTQDFLCIYPVTDYAFQTDKKGNYKIAVRGQNTDTGDYTSLVIDPATNKIITLKNSSSMPPFHVSEDDQISLSANEVIHIITNTYGYDKMDFGEGGISICSIPGYGLFYNVGGGCYNLKNVHYDEYGEYYDYDRVDVLMDPFTGEIVASSRMPYSAY